MHRDHAVEATGVGKFYRLGEHTGYQLLSEVLGDRVRSLGRRRPRREEFWAVRDLSFTVDRGETFGIIGHNGAGKSTLLKMLSRITPPTTGQVRLRGQVGALLEVGTGFHSELTGRENIFLNGAILGMPRDEIARKFDEIVDFAELRQFIDTPVKRYSSGMYLRLGFAVAAHLEPDILIVDEVLSVGDLAFQEKCMGRMESVASEGRTVLFVSHNLAAVRKLCPRSMLLSGGRKVAEGPTDEVLNEYMSNLRTRGGLVLSRRTDRQGSGSFRFESVVLRSDGRDIDVPITGRELEIAIRYRSADGRPVRTPTIGISFYTTLGSLILQCQNDVAGADFPEVPPEGEIVLKMPKLALPAGRYVINLFGTTSGDVADWVTRAAEVTVAEGDFYASGRTASESAQAVLVEQVWEAREADGLELPDGTEGVRAVESGRS